MGTLVLFTLAGIAGAILLFLLVARVFPAGEQIAPPVRDEPIWALPAERALEPDDVAEVRLPVALRGYRFAETDLLLDRLGDEIKRRDDEIAALRSGQPYPRSTVAEAPAETAAPTETASPAESASETAEL